MAHHEPYTKMPKWAMAVLIEGRLKPREVQVFAFVLERTVGFNDDFTPLPPKRIAEATGLGNHVYGALESLLEMGVLVETEDGIGPSKELPNRYSQIGSKSLPNREKKTPKSGVRTGSKSADNADPGKAKKLSKKTTQENPLTPISENEVVRHWLRDVYGVETIEDAKRLSEKGKQSLREILSFSVAAQERAVKVIRSWPAKVDSPSGFLLTILKDPGSFPLPQETTSNVVTIQPERFPGKPWRHLWRKQIGDDSNAFIKLVFSCKYDYKWPIDENTLGRLFEEEGLEAAMDALWAHHPKAKEA